MDEGVGYHVFPSKNFCLTLPKEITWNSSSLRKDSGSDDVLWMGGDVKFFRRSFFVSHFRKVSLESLRCFKKILTAKAIYGCEGDITFFRRTFLSRVTEFFQWELFVVSEKNGIGGNIWTRQGASQFSIKFVFVSIPKKFIENFSVFQKNSVSEKKPLDERGYLFFFVSFYRKTSLRTFRCFGKILLARKFHGWEKGVSRFFVLSQFFCITVSKILIGNSPLLQKFSSSENL